MATSAGVDENEAGLTYFQRYYRANREKRLEDSKAWNKKNREHVNRNNKAAYRRRSVRANPPRPGLVYLLIHEAWPEAVKIGATVNLKVRLSQHRTSCPYGLFEYLATREFPDTRPVEWDFLDTFETLSGEWCKVDPDVAAAWLEAYDPATSPYIFEED